jgi:hypothetical protein
MKPLTNPVALEARRTARAAIIANISRTVEDSRTADKFILRCTPKFLAALTDMASNQGRSLNAEIVIGSLEALSGGAALKATSSALSSFVGKEAADKALGKVKRLTAKSAQGAEQFVIRLPNGLRGAISSEVELAKLVGEGSTTLQHWFQTSLIWWVNTHLEIRALTSLAVEKPVLS